MRRAVAISISVLAAALGAGVAGGPAPAAALVLLRAAAGPNLVVNGGFETGDFTGWSTSGASASVVGTAHTGSFAAQLGSPSPTNGNSTMQQTLTLPANATLTFFYQPHCPDTIARDKEQMNVRSASGSVLLRVLNVCSNSGAWTPVSQSLAPFAGRKVQLWFNNHDDNRAGNATYTLFDDVSVTAPAPGDDFSISANPGAVTVAPGASAVTTISTAVTSGSAQTVALSAAGLPTGASAAFSPPSVTAGGSSTLTITTTSSTPPGTAAVVVTGTGPSATHSTPVTLTVSGPPPPGLVALGQDPYSNASSEHATEVEPDTLSNGSTLVSAFQVARFSNGGADDIGWATSTDNGQTWANGLLPGITTFQGGGTWARASDPSVAYDARHGVWLIASLVLDSSATGRGVAINRSSDGLTWSGSVNAVTNSASFLDKDWIVCDSTATSAHYGNCYVEYDNNSAGNLVQMITSTDGGQTWAAPQPTADSAHGLGGQPLVQPSGTVVVPYLADTVGQVRSFVSTNGGASWGASVAISSSTAHAVAGGMRTTPLPSAEIDGAGTVYVAWQDCRFRVGCSANDIVLSSSSNGTTWSAVQRVPIDATTSPADHFIPGLAVDRGTSGGSAHLGLYYYYFPNSSCSVGSCQLDLGFVSSADGAATWSAASQVAGPSTIGEIASTTEGAMVGDYISASFLNGRSFPVFAVGQLPAGSTYNESMFTVAGGLAAVGGPVVPDVAVGAAVGAAPGVRLSGSALTAF